jgi:mono/diheme cytochrome c family protein
MRIGPIEGVIIACTLLIFSFVLGAAQERQTARSPSPESGSETYKEYCAVCHGKTGKGDGPAASALKVRPPDLTVLARRHGGKFPDTYVSSVLRNGVNMSAHGTAEMPIWGPLFLAIDSHFQSQVNLRITNLTNYIRSLQTK